MVKIIFTLVTATVSALFYHASGLGEDGEQLYPNLPSWFFARGWRRLGCPLLDSLTLLIWWQPSSTLGWGMVLLSFGLCCAAITTYHDYLGEDNFWMHGLGVGLARLPLLFAGMSWVRVLLRSLTLAVVMGVVSRVTGDVRKEELGRGFSIPALSWI